MEQPRYITLRQTSDMFPTRPTRSALSRWILVGIKTRDGGRVRLRADRLGAAWLTTPEWVSEFVAALTAARVGPTPPRSAGERDKAAVRTGEELAEAGW